MGLDGMHQHFQDPSFTYRICFALIETTCQLMDSKAKSRKQLAVPYWTCFESGLVQHAETATALALFAWQPKPMASLNLCCPKCCQAWVAVPQAISLRQADEMVCPQDHRDTVYIP